MRAHRSICLALGLLILPAAPISAQEGGLVLNAQLGIPQGEFAKNVLLAGGFGLGLIVPLASEFGIRAGFDIQLYGSETQRLVIPAGPAGNINAEINTTNAIVGLSIGAQIGLPSKRAKPYIGGMLGFSNFTTNSSAEGEESDSEPFASQTNASDNAFSKHLMAGIYIPVADGNVLFDLGARYTWNGESVRYLTRGDISEDALGNVVLNLRESPANLFTVTLGVTFRFSDVTAQQR
jgi:hypothetical protein